VDGLRNKSEVVQQTSSTTFCYNIQQDTTIQQDVVVVRILWICRKTRCRFAAVLVLLLVLYVVQEIYNM